MKPMIYDKNFSHLNRATDPRAMAVAFDKFFEREYPDLELTVECCEINRVYHKPGKKCDITYQVFGNDGQRQSYTQWFYGVMFKDGEKKFPNLETMPENWPGCGHWKPFSILPEMNMALYAFPYNRKMPYLSQLLDKEFIKGKIESNLDGFGLQKAWQCQEIDIEKLKYRHGKSCVLRYHTVLQNEAGKRLPISFFSKTYATGLSKYVYDALSAICQQTVQQSNVLNIPQPIAHIDETNTLWQQEWKGKSLRSFGEEFGWGGFLASDLIPKIAQMLAELHCLNVPNISLDSGPSIEDVLTEASDKVSKINKHLPGYEHQLKKILTAIKQATENCAEKSAPGIIHGTFKLSQILHNEGQLALIDFDAVALGDPLYDVAEYIASVKFLVVTEDISPEVVKQSIEKFLAEYRKHIAFDYDRQRLSVYVAAFLLGKTHALLKKLESRSDAVISGVFNLFKTVVL